jgi:hypothetical protein
MYKITLTHDNETFDAQTAAGVIKLLRFIVCILDKGETIRIENLTTLEVFEITNHRVSDIAELMTLAGWK